MAVNLELVADDAHDRDVFPRPIALLQHLEAVGLDPFDLLAVHRPRAQRLAEQEPKLLVLGRAGERRVVVRVQVQRGGRVLEVEILRDPDGILGQPLRQARIAHALRHQARHGPRVGEQALVLVLRHVLGDEAPLRVSPARVLNRRVHVDREGVSHPADLDILVEAVLAAVLGQQPDVALAVGHLVVAGGVICHVGVRNVLDVTHHAVENLGHAGVGAVVSGYHLARRAVLALLVRHLADVLRQLVDRQARPGACGLPLRAAARRKDVFRPLPLVVRAAGHEAKIVQFAFPAVRVRRNRCREPAPHDRHPFRVVSAGHPYFLPFLAARCVA